MTQAQFEKRIIEIGGSEREAELIAARYFDGHWMDQPATKITNEQREAMMTLLSDRREEDMEQAHITNNWANNHEIAGYRIDWRAL